MTLLLATGASAQPRPRPTFATTTRYGSCSTSWAFACGMRDNAGNTYGRAVEMPHCERYVFQPDGTFKNGLNSGTYKIIKNTVKLVMPNGDGTAQTLELVLSADGAKLDGMRRLTR